jgi:hypothetical protein
LTDALKASTDGSKKKPSPESIASSAPSKPNPSPQEAQPAAPRPTEAENKSLPEVSCWRDVVQLWGKVKPLQAKIFEDTYEVRFSADEIAVAVDETSLAGSRLLQTGTQNKVEKAFLDLFGFRGRFRAIPKSQVESNESNAEVDAGSEDKIQGASSIEPETLREERKMRLDSFAKSNWLKIL